MTAIPHDNPVLEAALAFQEVGCSVIPVATDGSKKPALSRWKPFQQQAATRDQVTSWFTGGHPGLGLVTGNVSGNLLMVELEGRAVAEGMLAELAEIALASGLGELWTRVTRGYMEATPSGGVHILVRVLGLIAGNTKLARRPGPPDPVTGKPTLQVLAETRGEGGYVVVAPSHGPVHDTGKAWQRAIGTPYTIPDLLPAEADALLTLIRCLDRMPDEPQPIPAAKPQPTDPVTAFLFGSPTAAADGALSPGDDFNARASWEDILIPHGWKIVRRGAIETTWKRPGKTEPGISATTGYGAGDWMYVFSSSTELPDNQTLTKFAVHAHLEHGGDYSAAARALRTAGYGTPPPGLQAAAINSGGDVNGAPGVVPSKDGHDGVSQPPPAVPASPPAPSTTITLTSEAGFTDTGNAELLVGRHHHELRYVPERGQWLRWGGTHWSWDESGVVMERAKATVLAIPTEDEQLRKHRTRSLSRRALEAMVVLARTHPAVVAPAALLDSDPYALCTPAGVVDLTTAEVGPARPEDLHTRSTAVPVDPAMPTPRWDAFLEQTFGGDQELLGFVQRVAGYSATGVVTHHVLPFLHGNGQNGKSVFTEVMRRVLGDYAASAPSSFLMSGMQQHETEIARLAGLRMVICSEVNQEQRFDEAKVKILTGGDALTARFMRQDHFTFVPTHHLWLMGNHQPRVAAGGDSFWRRLRLVPFAFRVADDKKVEGLDRILVDEEGPGILAWLVQGARMALSSGLQEPATVLAATKTYAAEEDALARFVEDRCMLGGSQAVKTNTADVRRAYAAWCSDEGERAVSPQVFGRELRTRYGIDQARSHGQRFYVGLALLSDEQEPDPEPHWSDR